ncbi:MAG: hypothetical protein ACKVS8_12710 [Phycisphaerales bacterium]
MRSFAVLMLAAASAAGMAAATGANAQDLLASNFSSSTITRFDLNTRQLKATHGPGSGLSAPLASRVGPDGRLYVTSEGSDAILRYNPNTGAFIDTFIAPGSGGLTQPTGLDWGPDGNLYVASFNGNKVLRYHAGTGAFLSTFVTAGLGSLNGADNGMIFGPDGNLYIPSYNNGRVLKYNGTTGAFVSIFATVGLPRVILFRANDVLITSETVGVRRHNKTTGAFLSTFASSGVNGLITAIGMAAGPDGSIYVSSGNNRILKYSGVNGAFQQTFASGSPGLSLPTFLTVIVPTPGAAAPLALAAAFALRRKRTEG